MEIGDRMNFSTAYKNAMTEMLSTTNDPDFKKYTKDAEVQKAIEEVKKVADIGIFADNVLKNMKSRPFKSNVKVENL